MTVRIGITGPVGCGKSTVASWLHDLGAVTVDADDVARAVVSPGTPAFEAVVAAFGEGVRAADGGLDRGRLGRIVFADPDELARLEAIVHPAVRPRILEAMEAAIAAGSPAVVIEAIKLVEGGLADLCDEVWLVTCSVGEQRRRLEARGTPAEDAEARMAAQGPIEDRLRPFATRLIDTTGSIDTARARVAIAYRTAVGTDRRGSDHAPG